MKDFVTSQPAAGALFRMLMGDLSQFSVGSFRQKIESYVDGGGDGGLTRATMRSACGLEQELPAPRSAGGPAFVLNAEGRQRHIVGLPENAAEFSMKSLVATSSRPHQSRFTRR